MFTVGSCRRHWRHVPVGGELVFKPLPGVDTNHGSALATDIRSSERSYGSYLRIYRQGSAVQSAVNTVAVVKFLKQHQSSLQITCTARPEQAGNRYDEVYEKYAEITHR